MALQRSLRTVFREGRSETVTAAGVLVFALLVPTTMALVASMTIEVASGYLDAHRPVVYLEATEEGERAKALAEEIESWRAVSRARVRTPARARADLSERLGEEEMARLGVDDSMLPYSVIVEPAVPVLGHLDMVAETSALEVRSEVDTVDVPSGRAVEALSFARWVLLFGALVAFGAVAMGISHLRHYLVRLAESEEERRRLLTLFGAPPEAVARAALRRGLATGAVAGGVATVALAVLLALWYGAHPDLVGAEFRGSTAIWLTLLAPLGVGPLIGLVAGWLANRTIRRTEVDELELRDMLG
ncbi:MAG: cell division protein FtsX [Persicimonas sp.]